MAAEFWQQALQPIFHYCERRTTDWLGEPLGFSSNAAFLVAAFFIFRRRQTVRTESLKKKLLALGCFAAAVGVGSGLFHSIPNSITRTMDITPIAIYALTFIVLYSHELNTRGIAIGIRLFLLASLLMGSPLFAIATDFDQFLSRGAAYLGLIPGMLLLAFLEGDAHKKKVLWQSAVIFLGAYIARNIDQPLCSLWPYGTHFIWHLGTATCCYSLSRVFRDSESRI